MITTTRAAALSLTTLLGLAACGGTPNDESTTQDGAELGILPLSVGPTTLANSSPTGLVSSTGNLYWTSYAINEFGPDSATFWRASKSNSPGSEAALYSEVGDRSGFYYFGNVVWALSGTFFGYFVANYNDNGVATSQIKRVPLAGGAATVLATSPMPIGTRDIATDGTRLFWADGGGVRTMAIGGGAVTTLAGSLSVARLGLDANFVYYAEGNQVKRVPKAGGLIFTIVSTGNTIDTLFVDAPSASIFWGEHGGVVKSLPTTGGIVTTHQGALAGRDVTSVGFDGTRVLWTDCAEPGNTSCAVRKRSGGVTSVVSSGTVGAGHLQWDTASMYWGDTGGLRKFVH